MRHSRSIKLQPSLCKLSLCRFYTKMFISGIKTGICCGNWENTKVADYQVSCVPRQPATMHYDDVIMSAIASQITSLTIVYSIVYSDADQRNHQKLHVTGLCVGNSPGTGEFPAQMASYAENVSNWWRHHGYKSSRINGSLPSMRNDVNWPHHFSIYKW